MRGYYTTVATDLAEECLKRPRDGKPWSLMVGHKALHSFYFGLTPENDKRPLDESINSELPDPRVR